MTALLITVFLAAGISAMCSAMEAMLYALPWTEIEKMRSEGSKAGECLFNLRSNVDTPIAAILTLNTLANTAGAAMAGALAAKALGEGNMLYFSAAFTALILIVGEIVPKTLGVVYCVPLARLLAYPIAVLVIVLKPFTAAARLVTRLITRGADKPAATEEDIRVMARLSLKSGEIQAYEETAIDNILALDKKRVEDVMTPRTVIYSLPAETAMRDAADDEAFWHFSRIPVYSGDKENIVGIVQRRDVFRSVRGGHGDDALASVMGPVHFTMESITLDDLLKNFLDARQHLFIVLDEFGGLAGVVSLEDVLEEMLGREIVDESDVAPDLQDLARKKAEAFRGTAG
ncbi:MAG: DUF21 domain-containing protein [Mailhella sp.]|nr:DUF21 domain-containing protein [Mailhella sp.]